MVSKSNRAGNPAVPDRGHDLGEVSARPAAAAWRRRVLEQRPLDDFDGSMTGAAVARDRCRAVTQ